MRELAHLPLATSADVLSEVFISLRQILEVVSDVGGTTDSAGAPRK